MKLQNAFTEKLGIEYPIICGAMYPCSNPELVAAASEAGGLGIIQPLSLTYVYGHDFREGLKLLRQKTKKPLGLNILVEKSSQVYENRMREVTDIALEEGIRFFVTALGNPRWVVDKVHAVGGIVFHDVTERKWAEKALENGVDGLICVNNVAGGHAGTVSPKDLFESLKPLGVPLVCAGGVGDAAGFIEMLKLGYQAVQMGTRFVASTECQASEDYKRAIVSAKASQIVLTDKISGVPVSVIRTPFVDRIGVKAGPITRRLLKHPRTKHWMRLYYSLKSFRNLKRSIRQPMGYRDYYQAGKSVEGIEKIEPVKDIIHRFASQAQSA